MRDKWIVGAVLGAFALGISGAACAASRDRAFPTKPVRFIVSYPPGGPADILARELGQRLSAQLGETVVIDNRPGANGNIGAAVAARAAPDGYTIFMMTSSHAANMTLYAKPGYGVVRDFAHVTNVASYPLLLVVHPSVKATSVKDVIALAKVSPGKLTFSSAGAGGGAHLAGELFKTMAQVDMLHVPFNGTGPALIAVVGGQVNLMFAGVSAAMPHVSAGALRALGITSTRRLKPIGNIPTIAESGVAGYELSSWLGVSAPARTPPAIVRQLNVEIAKVVKTAEFADRLARDGAEPEITSAEQFSRYVESEVSRWAKIIRAAGAKVE